MNAAAFFLIGWLMLPASIPLASAVNMSPAKQVDSESIFCLPSHTVSDGVPESIRELALLPEKACNAYRTGELSTREYRTLLAWLPSLTVAYAALNGLETPQFAGKSKNTVTAIRSLILGSPPYRLLCAPQNEPSGHLLYSQSICLN